MKNTGFLHNCSNIS